MPREQEMTACNLSTFGTQESSGRRVRRPSCVSLRGETPTRVIGLKLGRPVAGVRAKASERGISLKPTNRSPRTPVTVRREHHCRALPTLRGDLEQSREI